MAKIKNKKSVSSEKSLKNTKQIKKTLNPFEIHINKEKIKVLGRKLKNDRGLPGIARAKALRKRKHTLLQEYKLKDKSNKFMDRRIGEKNFNLSQEDKVMARFTAERVKAHKRKSVFNLGDDEILTHKGQTLSEIEKFEDERSDDEDSIDGDNSGKLDSSFVSDVHFGGGVLKRTGNEGAKTHKELIEQLISESKKRKAEKQKLKEATLELTEKLDTEWKDLLPLVNKSKKSVDENEPKPPVDDYDKVMRELKFEARGNPSDRLKTEDEIAKIEKEKLENLEKQRLERMKGILDGEAKKIVHRSADDLDDDIVYDSDPELMLSYNEKGESNVKISAVVSNKNVEEHEENEDEDSDVDDNSNDSDSDQSVDDLSDVKYDSDSGESDVVVDSEVAKCVESKSEENISNSVTSDSLTNVESSINASKIRADLQQRKEIMEKAMQELPFTFALPDTYETLLKALENQSPLHQSVIIERMIKCNHPSLGENNKDNLGMLFVYLLQYLSDIASEATDDNSKKNCFQIFISLTPQLFDLAQLNPENTHNSLLEVIKEKHEEYRRKKTVYPGIEVLLFLKLISCLFSTSDFRHQIVTPSFIFIEQMLNKCKLRSRRDISYGLFLTALVLEYTSLSKRYLPAAINFLSGIIHSAIPKTRVQLLKILPPFKSTQNFLVLVDNTQYNDSSFRMQVTDIANKEIDDSFQIRALYTAVKQLKDFYVSLETLPSNLEIFGAPVSYLKLVPKDKYPLKVQEEIQDVLDLFEKSETTRNLQYIMMEKKRPKALKLYEPKIEVMYVFSYLICEICMSDVFSLIKPARVSSTTFSKCSSHSVVKLNHYLLFFLNFCW